MRKRVIDDDRRSRWGRRRSLARHMMKRSNRKLNRANNVSAYEEKFPTPYRPSLPISPQNRLKKKELRAPKRHREISMAAAISASPAPRRKSTLRYVKTPSIKRLRTRRSGALLEAHARAIRCCAGAKCRRRRMRESEAVTIGVWRKR